MASDKRCHHQAPSPATRVTAGMTRKGSYLEVTPAGGKLWRLEVSLWGQGKAAGDRRHTPRSACNAAREARDRARALRASGTRSRARSKKLQKAAVSKPNTPTGRVRGACSRVARGQEAAFGARYPQQERTRPTSAATSSLLCGQRPDFEDVTVPELLKLLRRIEERGAHETAHRVLGQHRRGLPLRNRIGQGRAQYRSRHQRRALQPVKKQHLAAVTEPKRVGELLRDDGCVTLGRLTVQSALKLAPLAFVRPGELRTGALGERSIWMRAEWRYHGDQNADRAHVVPLSQDRPSLRSSETLHPVTGRWEYVFPQLARSRRRPMSDNAILSALRRMEIDKRRDERPRIPGHGANDLG